MRLLLANDDGVYSPGLAALAEVASELGDAGYDVVAAVTSKDRSIRGIFRKRPHVVIAAGGDGTVARVAIALHKSRARVPMFILPIGTSNNIAHSLGVQGDVPDLVFAIPNAQTKSLDIGVVRAPWGREPFVEAAGFGFIGTMLERDTTMRERLSRAARRVRAAAGLRDESAAQNAGVARLIRTEPARTCRVCADGEDLSGQYVAIMAMSISRIGPRVVLAPHADSGDGLLDLILVRPEHREALADYVMNNAGAAGQLPPAITRRVRWVEIPWPASSGHVDDEPWPADDEASGETVRIEIDRAIEVLLT